VKRHFKEKHPLFQGEASGNSSEHCELSRKEQEKVFQGKACGHCWFDPATF